MCAFTCVGTCGGRGWCWDIFSITSSPYFLRQGLTLNRKLVILARLSPSKTLGSALSVPSTGVTDTGFHTQLFHGCWQSKLRVLLGFQGLFVLWVYYKTVRERKHGFYWLSQPSVYDLSDAFFEDGHSECQTQTLIDTHEIKTWVTHRCTWSHK